MLSNKNINPIVTELFIKGRKLNISLVFITQAYFTVPKNIRLNSTHYEMKIPNKRELQQTKFDHSSDIDFQDLMNLYKKVLQNHIPSSDNPLNFRKNLLERIIMAINDSIRDEKLRYNINTEATKISGLSSGKIDKYKFITDEKILPSDQSRIIEQAKFTHSPCGKVFERQIKRIEYQVEKHIKALKEHGIQLNLVVKNNF